MNFHSLIFLAIFVLALPVQGEEVARLRSVHTLETLEYDVGGDVGKLFVTIRKDGHLLGKPFNVELRPQCGQKKSAVADLRVVDMESACRLDKESLSWDPNLKKLSLRMWDVAAQDHSLKVLSQQSTQSIPCEGNAKTFVFDLSNLCR